MNTSYPVVERNELLLKMFVDNGFNAILVGSPHQPAIVIDESFAISGYVHNKIYHFCDKPFGGTEVFTVALSENPTISRTKILELIANTESRKLYKIRVRFGNEYQWFNNQRTNNLYFSPTDIRYYFSFQKATEMLEQLKSSGYEAEIVNGQ